MQIDPNELQKVKKFHIAKNYLQTTGIKFQNEKMDEFIDSLRFVEKRKKEKPVEAKPARKKTINEIFGSLELPEKVEQKYTEIKTNTFPIKILRNDKIVMFSKNGSAKAKSMDILIYNEESLSFKKIYSPRGFFDFTLEEDIPIVISIVNGYNVMTFKESCELINDWRSNMSLMIVPNGTEPSVSEEDIRDYIEINMESFQISQ